jgi:predicted nucleotidyltransferase
VAASAVVVGSADLAAVVPAVEGQVEVGNLALRKAMEQALNQLVDRLKEAAGENLHSVVLYGSAASGEFHQNFSDVNVLCLFQALSMNTMLALSEAVGWWRKQKHPAPLLLTIDEVNRSSDVFPIEFLDIQKHHRILYGEDVFASMKIARTLHRVQVEHELRTKLILFRQQFLIDATNSSKVLNLMLESLSSFVTLFRHSLWIAGEEPAGGKRALLLELEKRLQVDTKAFLDLLSVREGKLKSAALEVNTMLASYLKTIEQVISFVDQL